jgi:hypothetical protein
VLSRPQLQWLGELIGKKLEQLDILPNAAQHV